MATVLAAIYDPQSRRLTFSLAGHLPPLVARTTVRRRAAPARRSAPA